MPSLMTTARSLLDRGVASAQAQAQKGWFEPQVAKHDRFDTEAWERRRRQRVDSAFAEVLFYREQWAAAGHVLEEPEPAKAEDLDEELYRLCPIARPWDARREPSLWTGNPTQLRDALLLTDVTSPDLPCVEVRDAMVDWTRLSALGPRYASLLGPTASTKDASARDTLALPALTLAAQHGGAVLVGSAGERAAVLAQAARILGDVPLEWRQIDRCSPAAAAARVQEMHERTSQDGLVVHDPYLGYVAAWIPACGLVHLLWPHVHCRVSKGTLLFTLLRLQRPTLASVIPVHPGFTDVDLCPDHRTPVLVP